MIRISLLAGACLLLGTATVSWAQSVPGTAPLPGDDFVLRGSGDLTDADLQDAEIEDRDPLTDLSETDVDALDDDDDDGLRLRNTVLDEQLRLSRPSVLRAPVVRRPAPKVRAEPYDALGIKLGTFILRPSVDISVGYSDNVEESAGGAAGSVVTIEPDIVLESNWSRHSLVATLSGEYETFPDTDEEDDPSLDASLRGRVDVSGTLQVETELTYALDRTGTSDADVDSDAESGPLVHTFGGDVAVSKQFNRLTLRAGGGVERQIFGSTTLSDGSDGSNDDQNSTTITGSLRATYELSPAFSPFAELVVERELFDENVDDGGFNRDETAIVARVGTAYDLRGTLSGEASIGFIHARLDDDSLDDINGVSVNGSLIWEPTALTTITADIGTSVESTTLADSSGSLVYTAGLSVAHSLTEQWGLEGEVDVAHSHFMGIDRDETTITGNASVVYRINRAMSALARFSHERFISSVDGEDFTANSIVFGLRLQQ
ncbi:outer membrane beta-barrel protein [Coralliovum pocilloporae]|uniref:outer membrane beta-barrel protein n=1 Tax=Coralliovum pocilloporae TaxID=3066369 RepID=UPI003306B848